jgi:hypothetical protein
MFFELSDGPDVLGYFNEFIQTAPRSYGGFPLLQMAPPLPFVPQDRVGEPFVAVVSCWSGSSQDGEKILQGFRDVANPVAEHVGPMPYAALNSAFDGLVPRGLQHYWKAAFLEDLSAEAIRTHMEHGSRVPVVNSTVHLYPINGACHDVAADATAFGHRDATYAAVVAGMWPDPADNEANTAWVKGYYAAQRELDPPDGRRPAHFGSRPSTSVLVSAGASHRGRDLLEPALVQNCSLAPHSRGVDAKDPVHPDGTCPAVRVPGAGADVRPLAAGARLMYGIVGVVLAGQRQGQQPGSVVSDHQYRPILALMVVLLERHPRPDDLARVGHLTAAGVALVADRRGPVEVARVCPGGRTEADQAEDPSFDPCELRSQTLVHHGDTVTGKCALTANPREPGGCSPQG